MTTVFYILVWPLGILWKHKKVAILLAIITFGIISFVQYQKSTNPQTETQSYEQLPRQLAGLDVIQTNTRHYYVVSSYESDTQITLTDFYAFDTKWNRYNAIPLTFDKESVRIYKN